MFAYSCALVERMKAEFGRVKSDRKGVTALEYGLLAALIAIALIAGAGVLGNHLNNQFNAIAGHLTAT